MNRFAAAALLCLTTLSACNLDVTDVPNNPTDPTTETFAASTQVVIADMTRTEAGTYYKDFVVGTGDTFTGQTQTDVDYSAMLKNGYTFDYGQGVRLYMPDKVFGLQDGMYGMRVGGERLIVVPSALGWGNAVHGTVPPNSTLVFAIRLLALPQ